jgi:nitrate/nitrite transporter NarK
MGAYTTLYIYTPEAYPTRVRSLALGVNSGLARIGALVSPSLAVTAARKGHASAAEAGLAAAAAVAAVCVFCLRVETGGRQLTVTEVAPPSLEAPSVARARSKRALQRAATAAGRVEGA